MHIEQPALLVIKWRLFDLFAHGNAAERHGVDKGDDRANFNYLFLEVEIRKKRPDEDGAGVSGGNGVL
ncbi:MAG: hypothetical protein ABIK28_02550 [Planctomycetota bacterium]